MDLLIMLLGLSVLGLWMLWWTTFRALRRAEHVAAERQMRIESQLRVIEELLDRNGSAVDGMPHSQTRREARREVQQLLDRQ
ncbi:MAG: hypothetical protein AAGE01_11345 [Pseudomonadota bacterium]